MAQTVTFKSIPREAVVNQSDYEWLQQCIGTPLPLFQLTFDKDGNVVTLAVHTEDSCASVFMVKGIEYEVTLPPTIRRFKSGHVNMHCKCVRCGKTKVIQVSAEGARALKRGLAVQYAMPELSEDEREWLISSVCPDCWEALTR